MELDNEDLVCPSCTLAENLNMLRGWILWLMVSVFLFTFRCLPNSFYGVMLLRVATSLLSFCKKNSHAFQEVVHWCYIFSEFHLVVLAGICVGIGSTCYSIW